MEETQPGPAVTPAAELFDAPLLDVESDALFAAPEVPVTPAPVDPARFLITGSARAAAGVPSCAQMIRFITCLRSGPAIASGRPEKLAGRVRASRR